MAAKISKPMRSLLQFVHDNEPGVIPVFVARHHYHSERPMMRMTAARFLWRLVKIGYLRLVKYDYGSPVFETTSQGKAILGN